MLRINTLKYYFFKLTNRKPVIIMGMPKSGTTVIAALLGKKTGLSTLLDSPVFWPPFNFKLFRKELKLKDHLVCHNYIIANKILKEPNFTLLFEEFLKIFPHAKYVFISRKPEDNIRSILNRLKLPGNLNNIEDVTTPEDSWKHVFNSYYSTDKNYIKHLCFMWNKFTDVYLNNKEHFVLVRYEDFISNKAEAIEKLSNQLRLPSKNSIKQFENKQYQPKGQANIDLKLFFGENFKYIDLICAEHVKKLGY